MPSNTGFQSHPRADWLAHLQPGVPNHRITAAAQGNASSDALESWQDALWANSLLSWAVILEPEIKHVIAQAGLPPGASVLDAACGPGAKSHFLLESGAGHVTGIDIDIDELVLAEQLPTSPEHAERLRFQQGDLLRPLPFSDAAFDAVYVGNGFFDLYQPHVLDELLRVLRPGGTFILETTNLLPHIYYAWDRPLTSRVEAAHWQAMTDSDYGADGDTYERRFLAARSHLNGSVITVPVDRLPPFDPLLEHHLLQTFALHTAPHLRPYLTESDFQTLLKLYDPTGPDYLFQRDDAWVHLGISVIIGH